MPAQYVTDEEFMELWNKYGSATLVSRAVGVDVRSTHRRRKNIEAKHGVILNAKEKVIHRHGARKEFDINNGVVIVFSDAHFWPGLYSTAYRALVQFADQMQPDYLVCNGDAFDGASISRHPPIGWEGLPTVLEELEAVEDHLALLEAVAPKAKKIWPLGNHDSRYETRLATVSPEFKGIQNFHLKDHFPQWESCWSAIIGDVFFKHRYKGGLHSAFNNTVWSGKSICTGHDHQLWDRAFRDYNGIRYGVDTGTLADVGGPQFVHYTEDNPTGWNSGFYVLTFSKGRLLAPERVIVTDDDTVEFRGQQIGV